MRFEKEKSKAFLKLLPLCFKTQGILDFCSEQQHHRDMKTFSFFLRHRVLTSLTLMAGLLALSSCAARKLGPYTQEKIRNNLYFSFYKAQRDRKMLERISTSSFNLLRATYPEFLSDLERHLRKGDLLETLPTGLIHGDFHPQQMAWRNGVALLDDWDTVETGPLWRDIVRMESASQLLAHEEGLRAYPQSPCWDAYIQSFTKQKILSTDYALKPIAKNEEDTPDFSQNPAWKKAQNADKIPPDLLVAVNTWLTEQNDLPIKLSDPKKRLVSGIGSLLKEKIIFLDPKKQLWELKEVETLGDGEPCARYQQFDEVQTKLFSEPAVHGCWSWQGRSFTLLKWSARYWSPNTKDFKTTENLIRHTQWMCSELATFHKASLDDLAIRQWSLALQSETPLKQRISRLSDIIFKNYLDAHRMILLEQSN
jgi:hypothetical protein